MTYFLDFDRTLFDTDAFISRLLEHSTSEPASVERDEELGRMLEERMKKGEVIFPPEELKEFVYADVPEFLRGAGNEATIVTYGNPLLQKFKIEHALKGIPRLSVFYTDQTRKGEFLTSRIHAYASPVFVDDRTIELESVMTHCPAVRVYEMRRDGGAGDGRWPVIRSLTELP
ncbi:MAG: hypothetical protein WAV21_02835 [Minisyncoccia bacterium]